MVDVFNGRLDGDIRGRLPRQCRIGEDAVTLDEITKRIRLFARRNEAILQMIPCADGAGGVQAQGELAVVADTDRRRMRK